MPRRIFTVAEVVLLVTVILLLQLFLQRTRCRCRRCRHDWAGISFVALVGPMYFWHLLVLAVL